MGEGGYKIFYALVSLAGLALIAWGFADYRATGWIDVWTPPKAFKHITVGADAAGRHPGGRLLYPRPHLHRR